MTSAATPIEVSWAWDFVPSDEADRGPWTEFMAGLLDGWVSEQVEAARAAWPADATEEFPFSPGAVGSAVARDLLERADGLPANCRLVWGAGFVDDRVRWLPLLVLAEFREAGPGDPAYLMSMVGAEGLPDDVRPPNVEYVSTDHGDGIRVLALARNEAEGLHGRVNAALRLEGSDREIDVLLTTRVSDLEQVAVIGAGVEAVMHLIATQFGAQPQDAVAPLRFVPAGGVA
ncbi:hypothetical protein ACFY1S_18855 [Micromonospora sp. NPDC000663]|uniref:hypothetical protein n=1 Tax=Micromonospora sp. NPDC000663 TaxID=3364218 RepID=UPI003696B4EB